MTRTTVGSLDSTVTFAPRTGSPRKSSAVIWRNTASVLLSTRLSGSTSSETARCCTVKSTVVVMSPLAAVMKTCWRGPFEVTRPVAETVATRGSLELKVTGSPAITRPPASTTTALSCRVNPCCTVGWFGVTTMLAGTRGPPSSLPQARLRLKHTSATALA